jgi:hypothetical protein
MGAGGQNRREKWLGKGKSRVKFTCGQELRCNYGLNIENFFMG